MLQALAAAPADDEPSDTEEDAGATEALAVYGRGEVAAARTCAASLIPIERSLAL